MAKTYNAKHFESALYHTTSTNISDIKNSLVDITLWFGFNIEEPHDRVVDLLFK